MKFGYVLDLENVFFIPEFSWNLISVSRLDTVGFIFWFINSTFSIFKGEQFIGGGIKTDGLFKIDLDPSFDPLFLFFCFLLSEQKYCQTQNTLKNTWKSHVARNIKKLSTCANYEKQIETIP